MQLPASIFAFTCHALCLVFLPILAVAFSEIQNPQLFPRSHRHTVRTNPSSSQPPLTTLNLFPLPWSNKKGIPQDKNDVWGDEVVQDGEQKGKSSGKNGTKANTVTRSSSNTGKAGLGGVAGIMDSMENFKTAQQVGKMTNSLVQDLQKETYEGVAMEGKVKVVFDGQQRPIGVQIDEAYLAGADASELNSALTSAMKDAYQKSSEKMDEKMKSFYIDLGLK